MESYITWTSTDSCASKTSSVRPSSSVLAGASYASRTVRGGLGLPRRLTVLDALRDLAAATDDYVLDEEEQGTLRPPLEPLKESGPKKKTRVSAEGAAIMAALGEDNRAEEDVFCYARDAMGYQRLGPKIRESFVAAARVLVRDGWVSFEDASTS